MSVISKDDVDKILSPYYDRIETVIESGWQEYETHYISEQYRLEERTRANILRDIIVNKSRTDFFGDPNIKFRERHGLFVLEFHSQIFLRFKKLDQNLVASNILTNQQISFINQGCLFPECEYSVNLNAGYLVDRLWNGISGIYISCQRGLMIDWFLDLRNRDSVIQMTLESDEIKPVERIKLKSSTQKEQGQNE